MPGVNTYLRTKPYMQILRGDDPQNPRYLSETAPVQTNVTLKSGQVCSLYLNASSEWEWVLGWATGRIPHWARQDSDSPDVLEAGLLTGLSAMGEFRLRVAYYKTDASLSYIAGRPLVPDSTTGNITTSDGAAGAAICGYVSNKMNGPRDIGSGVNASGVWLEGENTEASTSLVIDFDTVWSVQAGN